LDLRLDDNPALLAAVSAGAGVVPVFIWAPEEEAAWPPGAASRWWLHQSLVRLHESLAALGSRLILRSGPAERALERLLTETGARAVFWNRRHEPAAASRDDAIATALRARGIRVEMHHGSTLFDPSALRTKSSQRPFQVFSAFWKACLSQPEPAAPRGAPRRIPAPAAWPESLALSDLKLEPRVDWTSGLRTAWNPGEAGAIAQFEAFLQDRLNRYPSDRDLPGRTGTSRLSPHLHFGEISPRRIWHAVKRLRTAETAEAVEGYLRELGWREFAYHVLHHFPDTPNQPLRPEFAAFPWRSDASLLRTWQRGETGYPLVDAAMRELWATGWMHNRVRMVVASFLTKHLRIDWQEGAYWFWDTLVDADLASNTLNWQWAAGCGADAGPYFRIFNPVRQSERFDPDGAYIRRWVPELTALPSEWIHAPWSAPASVYDQCGIKLGATYPLPVVEHAAARREALAAFARMRGLTPARLTSSPRSSGISRRARRSRPASP
jgi:deoxyribodipyrimidine photo-lyase